MAGQPIGEAILELATNIEGFRRDLGDARKAATALQHSFNRQRKQQQSGLAKLSKGWSSMTGSVRAVALGVGALGVAAGGALFALDRLVKRGGEVLNVGRAFARVAGDQAEAIARLERATAGLVARQDLMLQFNRAIALGSARNISQFGQLATTAITLGRALGVDAAFALESLSLGIGRQSRLILDNLGLIVSVGQANKSYAESIGTTVAELTDAQKAEAFRVAAMESARRKIQELGGITLGTADSFTRIRVAIRNATDRLAAFTAQSPEIAELATSIERDLVPAFEQLATVLARVVSFGAERLNLLGLTFRRGGPEAAALSDLIQRTPKERLPLLLAQLSRELETSRARTSERLGALGGRGGESARSLLLSRAIVEAATQLERLRAAAEQATTAHNENARAVSDGARLLAAFTMPTPGIIPTGPSFAARGLAAAAARREEIAAEQARIRGLPRDLFSVEGLMEEAERAIKPVVPRFAELETEARRFDVSAQVAVASFGAMAEAAIRNSQLTADAIIGMLARIAQSLPGVSGLGAALIGAAGGILGGLFGRQRDPVPVRVARVDPQAARELRPVINQQLVLARGLTPEEIAEIEQRLLTRSTRDANNRVPRAA